MRTILLLIGFALSVVDPAKAQQANIPPVAIIFAGGSAAVAARMTAFRAGLNELGYRGGKNIIIADRYADGQLDRIPGLVSEVIRLRADVIVTGGPGSNSSD